MKRPRWMPRHKDSPLCRTQDEMNILTAVLEALTSRNTTEPIRLEQA